MYFSNPQPLWIICKELRLIKQWNQRKWVSKRSSLWRIYRLKSARLILANYMSSLAIFCSIFSQNSVLGNGQDKVFSDLLQFTLRQNPPISFVTKWYLWLMHPCLITFDSKSHTFRDYGLLPKMYKSFEIETNQTQRVLVSRHFPLPCIRRKWTPENEMRSRTQRVSAIGLFYRPWPPSSPRSCHRGSNGNPTLRVFKPVN